MLDFAAHIFAHSLPGQPQGLWETLGAHAEKVTLLAEDFAGAFNARDWGTLLGRWHDLGKASEEFQQRMQLHNGDPDAGEEQSKNAGRVDHSTFGSRYAVSQYPGKDTGDVLLPGQILAACIAGHHAGLPNLGPSNERRTLGLRLDPTMTTIPHVEMPTPVTATPKLRFPFTVDTAHAAHAGFQLAFFARMLFSCLIDADRTATERFCNPTQAAERNCPRPSLTDLCSRLDDHLRLMEMNAASTPVNTIRRGVLAECLAAAGNPTGFFSLNVPTGGGKTLASLAFALHHAAANPRLRRVVVAIPFTSIIEQTADVYRSVLGELADSGLVEHHSNLNPKRDTRHNKLSSENWVTPLVVTTNVQLLESLFTSKTTPARKLHRLANSVIVLDEAQTLPVELLASTINALRELVSHYGCSIVLCTATQPALEYRKDDFEIGLTNVKPIVADANALHASLKRVEVQKFGKLEDALLVERIAAESQVLCVVNTKRHASDLFDALKLKLGDSRTCFHLSTWMCPQHRRKTLAKIRLTLKKKRSCRVISTQLIEAGVDLNFPCVYRAEAGFDSIAQSAGRCNREGTLTDSMGNPMLGRVYVFKAEIKPPAGMLGSAAETASEIEFRFADPISPDAILAYFKQFYWRVGSAKNWDSGEVLPCFNFNTEDGSHRRLAHLQFASASEAYRIIRDEQTPVVVPYNSAALRLIEHLQAGLPLEYGHYKLVQQYSVGVRADLLEKLCDNAAVIEHPDGVWFIPNPANYSPEKGLLANVVGLGPEALMQ